MSNNISEHKKVTTETEIGSNGVGHSTMLNKSAEGSNEPSAEELKLALVASQQAINNLTAEVARLKAAPATDPNQSSLNTLVELLSNAITSKTQAVGPSDVDNINRTENFKERNMIDGKSLMEAQATLNMYKNEPKEYISIPKTFAHQFGPTLVITVNGVRVAIPVDGKSYYINQTHAIHARERIAKVDRLLSDSEPKIVETVA